MFPSKNKNNATQRATEHLLCASPCLSVQQKDILKISSKMKKYILPLKALAFMLFLISCNNTPKGFVSIRPELLRDKIAGGWAGKMIGVTYGAPTEFRAQGSLFADSINWKPSDIKGSIWQDDLYVQLTFLMSMDKFGINAPAKKFQEMFARAGYPLWHANMMARKNYYDSIFAPRSGSPEYNMHADDIDFQIEADYIGFMCPGMPLKANEIADRIGHIMNYGDGVYGGIFVSSLYSEAFFDSDINKIIEKALGSIPAESDYSKIIRDVILLHDHFPADWKSAWKEIQNKWGDVDICGAGDKFNIDAKLNGAFIVIGLLYGDGDPMKTLEITTRCGQDSDCNPSNAMAVLGVIKGFSNLPAFMRKGVMDVADSAFINTNYTFNKAVESTYNYAISLIKENGGEVKNSNILVKAQQPVSPKLEIAFPGLVFDKAVPAGDKKSWKIKGSWKELAKTSKDDQGTARLYSNKKGNELELKFNGTGISINGDWVKDGGKADIYIDGVLNRTIDTYYNFSGQEHKDISIWHAFGFLQGDHTLRIVVKGEKRPESADTNIYISGALVFRTGKKLNETYKFSF
jgi:ADP-ribosylglycohydrolase